MVAQTSKIAAAFIAALLLLVIFWSRKVFTVIMCLVFVAAIIGCYFIPNPAGGEIMRYFILFVGYALKTLPAASVACLPGCADAGWSREQCGFVRRVMSCTYSFWDIIDDLVMRKVNDSDATKFAEICR